MSTGREMRRSIMARLLIEYRVTDFEDWKRVFDGDPLERRTHGVTGHDIYHDADDPQHFLLGLDFASVDEAKRFRNLPALQQVWEISGAGEAWILGQGERAIY
jgi:hypothetical protein